MPEREKLATLFDSSGSDDDDDDEDERRASDDAFLDDGNVASDGALFHATVDATNDLARSRPGDDAAPRRREDEEDDDNVPLSGYLHRVGDMDAFDIDVRDVIESGRYEDTELPAVIKQIRDRMTAEARRARDDRVRSGAPPAVDAVLTGEVSELSVTINIDGEDIAVETFRSIVRFFDSHGAVHCMSLERGPEEERLHCQGVVRIRLTRWNNSVRSLSVAIKKHLGWGVANGGNNRQRVSIKTLTYDRIHNWIGMLGYVTKDEHMPWYLNSRSPQIPADDITRGQEMYARLGRSPLKRTTYLTTTNMLEKAVLWERYMAHGQKMDTIIDVLVAIQPS